MLSEDAFVCERDETADREIILHEEHNRWTSVFIREAAADMHPGTPLCRRAPGPNGSA